MKFKHQFLEFIPSDLDDGILYVSMEYGTATHLCACGCGEKVVTPFGRQFWKLTYDGDSVTLYPSIGNWSLPCRSHYWIRRGKIKWAETWTEWEVDQYRKREADEK